MRSRQIFFVIAALILLGVGLGGWYWLQASKKTAGAASTGARVAQTEVPVVIAQVKQQDFPVNITVIGRAEAKTSVTLRSRVDGQVLANDFKEGQPVKKGQVLVRIDPASFATQLRQVEATLAKDQAQVEKLHTDLKRNQDLSKQGFISDAALNQTQTDLAAAEAVLRSDAATVDNARLTLSYTSVRAPMDGVAGAIQVYPGGVARSNDTALVTINQVQPIYVTFSLPEARLAQLKSSLTKGAVAVLASLPGKADTVVQGQVAFLNNAVDITNGTILVKALFDNPSSLFTPGQFINLSLVIEQIPNAIIVPSPAVQTNPKGNFVYVVKADNTVETRPVTVQLVNGNDAVVTGGLKAADTVVTDGQLRLKPGTKVKTSVQPVGTVPTDVPKLTS